MRNIQVKREKAFTGAGRKWEIHIDGEVATTISNAETVDIPVDEKAHIIQIVFKFTVFKKLASVPLKVPAGNQTCKYSTYIKNNFLGYTLGLEVARPKKN